jgi:purine-binding chemotaxis protein CheW
MVIRMKTLSEYESVLRQRTEKLAIRRKLTHAVEKKISVAVFSTGSEQFAIPTEYLSCIVNTPKLALTPNLSPWLKGIAQIRGDLVSAVDLGIWLGVPKQSKETFLVVVEKEKQKLGLLIDQIQGFRDIGKSDIAENFSSTASSEGHPIRATTRDLIAILDVPKLFESPDLCVNSTLAPAWANEEAG